MLLPEAPLSLFSDKIGDSQVDLFAHGSWKTSIGGTLGINTATGEAATFPGFVQIPWTNDVDLTLSLWIREQYFFQADFSDGFTSNTFLLGYESPDKDPQGLKSVRIGNKEVTIDRYPGLPFQGQADSSPGIRASWIWQKTQFEVLARLINSAHYVEHFEGGQAIGTATTLADKFIRNRFFVLPYKNLTDLQVWIEDNAGSLAGDGKKYRIAQVKDFSFVDLPNGSFALAKPAGGRVRVSYNVGSAGSAQDFIVPTIPFSTTTKAAFDLTLGSSYQTQVAAALTSNFGWSAQEASNNPQVTIDGYNTILVSIPGSFSPFEDFSWYSLAVGSHPTRAMLSTEVPPLQISYISDAFRILNGTDSLSGRYPLSTATGVDPDEMYFHATPSVQTVIPLISVTSPSGETGDGIRLSRPALEGSIVVFRNGSLDAGASLASDGQSIQFTNPPRPDEIIEVAYDSLEHEGGAQAVQAGAGLMLQGTDNSTFSAGIGLHWPVATQNTTLQDGSGRLSSGIQYDLGSIETGSGVRLSFLAGMSVPSTSGSKIINNFSDSYLSVVSSPNSISPSRFPTAAMFADMKDNTNHPALISGDLGYLSSPFLSGLSQLPFSSYLVPLFRVSADSSGVYLPWDSLSALPITPAPGAAVGPYIAASPDGDQIGGNVTVIELDQGSGTGQSWSSIELRLGADQSLALSNSGKLSFALQTPDLTRPVDIFIQIGDLDDDIDYDGVLSPGSIGARGFPYALPDGSGYAVAQSTVVGRDGSIPSEDRDTNGLINDERLSSSFGRYIGHFSSGLHSGWNLVELEANQGEMRRLLKTGAIRFLILSDAGAVALRGRVILGGLKIDNPVFVAKTTAPSSASTAIIIDKTKETALETSFPQAFPTDSNAGIARLRWTWATSSDPTVTFDEIFDTFSFEEFGKFYFYILSTQAGMDLSFKLSGTGDYASDSVGFSGQLQNGNQWYKVQIDTRISKAEIIDSGGAVISQSDLNRSGTGLSFSSVSIEVQSTGGGDLFVDNIGLSSPIPSVNLAINAQAAWRYPGTLLSADKINIFGNIRTDQSLSMRVSRAISEGSFVSARDPSFEYSGSAGFTLLYTDLAAGIRTEWQDIPLFIEGFDKIVFPSGLDLPLTLNDSFSARFADTAENYTKDSSLTLVVPGIVESKNTVSIKQSSYRLSQDFNLGVTIAQSLPLFADGSLSVSQTLPNSIVSTQDYFVLMGKGFSSYVPVDDATVDSRQSSISSAIHLKLTEFTTDLSAGLGFAATTSTPLPFSSNLNLVSHIVAGGEKTGFTIDFKYGRITTIQGSIGSPVYVSQLGQSLENFSEMPSSYASIPFVELADPFRLSQFQTESASFSAADQVPSASVSFSRKLDTEWTALVIPKTITVGVGRELSRKGSDVDDSQAIGLGLDWTAINLFGSKGSLPSIAEYESDQFSYSFYPQYYWGQNQSVVWNDTIGLSAMFLGLKIPGDAMQHATERSGAMSGLVDSQAPSSLKIDQGIRLSGQYPDFKDTASKTSLSFAWAVDLPELKPEIFNKKLGSVAFLYSKESIGISYADALTVPSPNGTALAAVLPKSSWNVDDRVAGWQFLVSHGTYLLLPGIGYGRASLDLGFYANKAGQLTIGVQASIEARIVL